MISQWNAFLSLFFSDFFVEQKLIKDPWHVVYFSITFIAPEMIMGSMFAGYDLIVLIAKQIMKGSMCVVYYIYTRIRENNYDSIIFLKVLISQWNAFLSLFSFWFFGWAANYKDPWHVIYFLMTFVAHQMIMGLIFGVYKLIVFIAQQIIKGSMCVMYDISTRIKEIIIFSLSSKRSWLHIEMHFYHIFLLDFFVEQQIIEDPWHVVYFSITFIAPEMIMG